MSKTMVQIRNVPSAFHSRLKARAAMEGMSMSDYILREVGKALDRPTRQEVLERVLTRGRCKFEVLANELGVSPQMIEEAIYDVVGLKLFTGYVNWPGREIIALEAEQISGDKCPNCGGAIELAGKGMARCPYCGAQTFLPQRDQ